MCLLINQKPGHCFSKEWLADFYKKNKDGFGVMYAKKGRVVVQKMVPEKVEDLFKFYYEKAAGKACSIHLRMQTHGDVDLINCHPYTVFSNDTDYPLFLMHNGVLSTGNESDKTKSDTWHYIKNFIRPALLADPKQFLEPWFKTMVESHIGARNKFVLMDGYGNTVTINEQAGKDWDGNWMSNTYAWNAAKAGLIPPAYQPGHYEGGRYVPPANGAASWKSKTPTPTPAPAAKGTTFWENKQFVPAPAPAKQKTLEPPVGHGMGGMRAADEENGFGVRDDDKVIDISKKPIVRVEKSIQEELEGALATQDMDSLGQYMKALELDSQDFCNDIRDAMMAADGRRYAGQIYVTDLEDLFFEDLDLAYSVLAGLRDGTVEPRDLVALLEDRLDDKVAQRLMG